MPNNRMHLTGYSGLRPLPPAGDAGRWASQVTAVHGRGRIVCSLPTGEQAVRLEG
jgi:hypothetical protein